MEQLCIFCEHIEWNEKVIGPHTTWTGPWTMSEHCFTCEMGQFDQSGVSPSDMDEYREVILKAQTCRHYKQVQPE